MALDQQTARAAAQAFVAATKQDRLYREFAADTGAATGLKAIFAKKSLHNSAGGSAAALEDARRSVTGIVRGLTTAEMQSSSATAMAEHRAIGALAASAAAAGFGRDGDIFRRATAFETAAVAAAQFASGSLAAQTFATAEARTGLAAAATAMHRPWLSIVDAALSAQAFVDIQAIGNALKARPAFDDAFAKALRPSLGDWRDQLDFPDAIIRDAVGRRAFYSARGMDAALTAFPGKAFDEATAAAGLADRPPVVDAETDGEADDEARSARAFALLRGFEQSVRRFIVRVLRDAHGDDWSAKGLPNGMRDGWMAKRDTAVAQGRDAQGDDEQGLIEYADFTDYKMIIERRGNWAAAFKLFFNRQEDVRESLQRLYPVRIATMHARAITADDELLLLVETKRVLKAITS